MVVDGWRLFHRRDSCTKLVESFRRRIGLKFFASIDSDGWKGGRERRRGIEGRRKGDGIFYTVVSRRTGHEKRENVVKGGEEKGKRDERGGGEKRNPRWPGCAVSLHNDDTPSSLHCLST